uniref:uracil phosphoribosyltransferase n=1 Tax=Sahlingia subintegra TaxID=468936 RepID=UPI001FCD52A8|nr:uracil phosphoribosyltransferase [Sahlingia subintegra]UNJ17309.1 uracil phosphoribosyltransferase [Sahlingia subintegra]
MQLKIYVPKHPIIEHLINLIQSLDIPPTLVRNSVTELAYWLCYEAMKNWITLKDVPSRNLDGTLMTQLINSEETFLALPLIKSGLVMSESVRKLSSNIQFFHVNFCAQGEASSFKVTEEDMSAFNNFCNYSKFLILDSIVLSSDKILSLLSLMKDKNVDLNSVRIIFILCTPNVLQDIGKIYPNLVIYTSCVKDIGDKAELVPYQKLLEYLQT